MDLPSLTNSCQSAKKCSEPRSVFHRFIMGKPGKMGGGLTRAEKGCHSLKEFVLNVLYNYIFSNEIRSNEVQNIKQSYYISCQLCSMAPIRPII